MCSMDIIFLVTRCVCVQTSRQTRCKHCRRPQLDDVVDDYDYSRSQSNHAHRSEM